MNNTNQPADVQLPSSFQLLKSTAIAAVVAMLLLLVIVMPAEYGIDPTGVGSVTGLKRMGEIKVLLAEEAAQDEEALLNAINGTAPTPPAEVVQIVSPSSTVVAEIAEPPLANGERSDEMQVTLAPDAATEVKVTLAKGKSVQFSWESNGGAVNFDTHGDSAALEINYFSYDKGTEQSQSGTVEAAFDGHHGWYWRNRTDTAVTITLRTTGAYTDIQQLL
tara:strand:- start:1308 stop:1967 length:660 start_codon:yes stop_codon:yes gene_type:complete